MDNNLMKNIDETILLGVINEKLRIECDNLDDLVKTYELNLSQVEHRLTELGYEYDPLTNQFKSCDR